MRKYRIALSLLLGFALLFSSRPAAAQSFPSSESITFGTMISGTFPTSLETSDNVRLVRDEELVQTQNDTFAPDTETLNAHPSGAGTFPTSLTSDDGDVLERLEKSSNITTTLEPDTDSVVKGTKAGTFPGDVTSDNDAYVTITEADQAGAPTFLDPDTDSVNKGTKAGTFPGDVTSNDNVYVTITEANQAPAQTLAYDASVESVRTATTDPYTWSHNPVGTARGVFVTAAQNVESTDCIASVTYAAASLTRVVSATDTATEPGRSYIYFIGSGIPTDDPATVSVDIAAAGACSTTDIQFVSISYTAGSDTEVIDSDSVNENTANPSVTLQYVSREALAVMVLFSGLAAIPITSACSGNSACTLDNNHDFGNQVSSVERQTTRGASNQIMGYTSGSDDTAMSVAALSQTNSAADYEMEYVVNFSSEVCVVTRTLAVQSFRANANMENVDVQVVDSTETTWATRITVSRTTDDDAYDLYTLSEDEWDSGNPNIRFVDVTQSGDSLQGQFSMDDIEIRCVAASDYEMEYRIDWSGETCSGTRTLRVQSFRANANMENVDVQVVDSTETTWTTRITVSRTTDDDAYDSYVLTSDEYDAGAPNIRFVDTNQAGDADAGQFSIDDVEIECVTTVYTFDFIQYDWVDTIPEVDTITLTLRAFRSGDTENPTFDVWDWEDLNWNEDKVIVSTGSELLYTYELIHACTASVDDCERGPGSDVRVRIHESTQDTTQTTISMDQMFIRVEDEDFLMEIRYNFTNVPSCETCTLTVEANRTVDSETINVEVLSPPSSWNVRLNVTETTDTTKTYNLLDVEFNGGNVSIRFVDVGGVGGGASRLSMDLIQIHDSFVPGADNTKAWILFAIVSMAGMAFLAWAFSGKGR